jgi:excinuclease ABC subunit A
MIFLSQGQSSPMAFRSTEGSWWGAIIESVAELHKIDLNAPWKTLTATQQKAILYGTGKQKLRIQYSNRQGNQRVYETTYEGVINNLMRRYSETASDGMRERIEEYMSQTPVKLARGNACAQKR